MSVWEDFIDKLQDPMGKLDKDELKSLVNSAKTDSEEFIKMQGEKLKLYLNQLATGEITKDQFAGCILDIKALTEMQALKMSVEAKAKAQRLAKGITDLIIDRLLSLL